jgi:hypothetical protein
MVIKEEGVDDLYTKFNDLREEYYNWRRMKLNSLENPENNMLLNLLMGCDDRKAGELLQWFIMHPSLKALELYLERIGNEFEKKPFFTVGVAAMGSEDVVKWAIERIVHNRPDLDIALRVVAASPRSEADDIAQEIIRKGSTGKISHLIDGYDLSTNINKMTRLREIISKRENLGGLKTSLLITLGNMVAHGEQGARELYERVIRDQVQSE